MSCDSLRHMPTHHREGFTDTVRSRLPKQDYICENPLHASPSDFLAFISHLPHKAFEVVWLFLCLMAKYQIISEAGHIISSLNAFINRVFVRPIWAQEVSWAVWAAIRPRGHLNDRVTNIVIIFKWSAVNGERGGVERLDSCLDAWWQKDTAGDVI